jgi:hypothetical protein
LTFTLWFTSCAGPAAGMGLLRCCCCCCICCGGVGYPCCRRVPTVPARRWRLRVGRRRRRRRRVVVVVVVAVWASGRRRSVGRRTWERRHLRRVPRVVVRWRAAAVGRTDRGLMRSGGRRTRGCVRGCRRGGRGRVRPLLRHGWSRDGRNG